MIHIMIFSSLFRQPKGPGFTAMHVTCMAGNVDVFKQVLDDEDDFLFCITAFRRSSKVGLIMHKDSIINNIIIVMSFPCM